MRWQRHFLALVPDDAARAALAALPLPAGARPVPAADLHLTLAFLGTLDEPGEVRALAVAAAVARCGLPPLRVQLAAVEYWRGPGILCAVAGEGVDPLAPLAAALSAGLAAGGLGAVEGREERPFRSHVTLARRVSRGLPSRVPMSTPITWPVAGIVLMASLAGDPGLPRYRQRGSLPFQ